MMTMEEGRSSDESPAENRQEKSDGNTSFLRAARDGNLSEVLEYLKGSTDINTSNANGLNALHLASKEGHVNIVTELLRRGANIEAATKKGNTALHIASLAGQEEVVKILVQNGAKVNAQSQNGFTPLYMAAQENHAEVVKFLLANSASPGLATEDGFTPLAVALQQGHDKVVAVLLEHDTKGKVRLPALHIAAKKNDTKSAALLLQNEQNTVDVTTKSGFTPLHISSHYGNVSVATLLIQKGADVNFKAKNNITPLHVAARWGKSNMVTLLVEHDGNFEEKTRDGLTPLHCASRSGFENVVDILLEKGASYSAKTKNGLTPLHMAAQGDHVDCARLLLYHKAPVDEVTVDYLTPLHVAAHCGNVKTAKLLLDRKCDANARALNGFTPLHIACKKNRIKVVELLLKYGASIEATTESGLTPLHVASFMGHMNIVIYLIQHNANPDFQTVRGETALHLAARANQSDIIRILLRNNATVDARAREQQTPLHIAARLGNVDNVALLLQHGASPDAATKDLYTPLHIAAKEGHEEVASVLLERGASLNTATKKGFTPLHIASKYGNIKVARLLLQKEANPDVQGKNGLTPLHVATHYNHVNVANLLLENGASPHSTAKNGYTPLHIAAKKNEMDIATTLLEYGAKPDCESKNGFTPLHLAAQEGHTDMVTLLLEHKADVNAKAHNGLTPLHLAAQEDRVNVAEVLSKYESAVDPQTKAGYTPLHTACHFGQINMVRYLLDQDASVSSTTKLGYTPLHQSAQQGHVMVVSELLKHKASPNAVTNTGQTPLSIAQKLGYISVVEVLKNVTEVTETVPASEDKYKVVSPETMQETLLSDSEDEGGDDFMPQSPLFGKPLSEQHVYLPYYEGQRLQTREDTLSVEKGDYITSQLDSSLEKAVQSDFIEAHMAAPAYTSMQGYAPGGRTLGESKMAEDSRYSSYSGSSFNTSFDPDNVAIDRTPVYSGFLVSFMVDARGGAMRGCRHSGVRVIIPPRKASMPTRVTCKLVKKEKLTHPPPLMEGEALASRILEMGPVGTKFLGPVIIEVPHFASLRGKEREIVILRSDNGEAWYEHPMQATEEMVNETLSGSFEELDQLEELHAKRICRIMTTDFPQYFAVVSRIRQENNNIGSEGGMLNSTVVPQVQAVFPDGALTKRIKVGLQAQAISPELVAKLLGNRVAVSPIVTVEPRRRKFHKPITLTIPVPKAAQKGMINQYGADAPTLRLLCSLSGGLTPAQWDDITNQTELTFVNDCVTFTTSVSARFWLMDCQNVNESARMAAELYKEAIAVPFMAKFVVFGKRHAQEEGRLRMFCMTDDKMDKTLERQEHFAEVARSRDVEVLENKPQYIEMAGNLIPVTKSGDQLYINFRGFRENRLPCTVRIRDLDQDPAARVAFMKEPKVARGDLPQSPICNLNIVLPDAIKSDSIEINAEDALELRKRYSVLRDHGLVLKDTVSRAQMKLTDVADTLQGDWVILAQQLDITMSEINKIKTEYETVSDQALAMLHLWVEKNGDRATGNELEKALVRINREDVVRKCMYNVETVEDEVEAAAARVAMDQSGFDTFREEVGISRDSSMKRGISLDVSYDEQDMIKESESANDESISSEGEGLDKRTEPVGERLKERGEEDFTRIVPPHAVGDETITAEVDDRRPQARPEYDDDEKSSEKRKEAYVGLISQMDQLMDEQERQRDNRDTDREEDRDSIKEDEVVRFQKGIPVTDDVFTKMEQMDQEAPCVAPSQSSSEGSIVYKDEQEIFLDTSWEKKHVSLLLLYFLEERIISESRTAEAFARVSEAQEQYGEPGEVSTAHETVCTTEDEVVDTPMITITEDNSVPWDEDKDDYVGYFAVQTQDQNQGGEEYQDEDEEEDEEEETDEDDFRKAEAEFRETELMETSPYTPSDGPYTERVEQFEITERPQSLTQEELRLMMSSYENVYDGIKVGAEVEGDGDIDEIGDRFDTRQPEPHLHPMERSSSFERLYEQALQSEDREGQDSTKAGDQGEVEDDKLSSSSSEVARVEDVEGIPDADVCHEASEEKTEETDVEEQFSPPAKLSPTQHTRDIDLPGFPVTIIPRPFSPDREMTDKWTDHPQSTDEDSTRPVDTNIGPEDEGTLPIQIDFEFGEESASSTDIERQLLERYGEDFHEIQQTTATFEYVSESHVSESTVSESAVATSREQAQSESEKKLPETEETETNDRLTFMAFDNMGFAAGDMETDELAPDSSEPCKAPQLSKDNISPEDLEEKPRLFDFSDEMTKEMSSECLSAQTMQEGSMTPELVQEATYGMGTERSESPGLTESVDKTVWESVEMIKEKQVESATDLTTGQPLTDSDTTLQKPPSVELDSDAEKTLAEMEARYKPTNEYETITDDTDTPGEQEDQTTFVPHEDECTGQVIEQIEQDQSGDEEQEDIEDRGSQGSSDDDQVFIEGLGEFKKVPWEIAHQFKRQFSESYLDQERKTSLSSVQSLDMGSFYRRDRDKDGDSQTVTFDIVGEGTTDLRDDQEYVYTKTAKFRLSSGSAKDDEPLPIEAESLHPVFLEETESGEPDPFNQETILSELPSSGRSHVHSEPQYSSHIARQISQEPHDQISETHDAIVIETILENRAQYLEEIAKQEQTWMSEYQNIQISEAMTFSTETLTETTAMSEETREEQYESKRYSSGSHYSSDAMTSSFVTAKTSLDVSMERSMFDSAHFQDAESEEMRTASVDVQLDEAQEEIESTSAESEDTVVIVADEAPIPVASVVSMESRLGQQELLREGADEKDRSISPSSIDTERLPTTYESQAEIQEEMQEEEMATTEAPRPGKFPMAVPFHGKALADNEVYESSETERESSEDKLSPIEETASGEMVEELPEDTDSTSKAPVEKKVSFQDGSKHSGEETIKTSTSSSDVSVEPTLLAASYDLDSGRVSHIVTAYDMSPDTVDQLIPIGVSPKTILSSPEDEVFEMVSPETEVRSQEGDGGGYPEHTPTESAESSSPSLCPPTPMTTPKEMDSTSHVKTDLEGAAQKMEELRATEDRIEYDEGVSTDQYLEKGVHASGDDSPGTPFEELSANDLLGYDEYMDEMRQVEMERSAESATSSSSFAEIGSSEYPFDLTSSSETGTLSGSMERSYPEPSAPPLHEVVTPTDLGRLRAEEQESSFDQSSPVSSSGLSEKELLSPVGAALLVHDQYNADELPDLVQSSVPPEDSSQLQDSPLQPFAPLSEDEKPAYLLNGPTEVDYFPEPEESEPLPLHVEASMAQQEEFRTSETLEQPDLLHSHTALQSQFRSDDQPLFGMSDVQADLLAFEEPGTETNVQSGVVSEEPNEEFFTGDATYSYSEAQFTSEITTSRVTTESIADDLFTHSEQRTISSEQTLYGLEMPSDELALAASQADATDTSERFDASTTATAQPGTEDEDDTGYEIDKQELFEAQVTEVPVEFVASALEPTEIEDEQYELPRDEVYPGKRALELEDSAVEDLTLTETYSDEVVPAEFHEAVVTSVPASFVRESLSSAESESDQDETPESIPKQSKTRESEDFQEVQPQMYETSPTYKLREEFEYDEDEKKRSEEKSRAGDEAEVEGAEAGPDGYAEADVAEAELEGEGDEGGDGLEADMMDRPEPELEKLVGEETKQDVEETSEFQESEAVDSERPPSPTPEDMLHHSEVSDQQIPFDGDDEQPDDSGHVSEELLERTACKFVASVLVEVQEKVELAKHRGSEDEEGPSEFQIDERKETEVTEQADERVVSPDLERSGSPAEDDRDPIITEQRTESPVLDERDMTTSTESPPQAAHKLARQPSEDIPEITITQHLHVEEDEGDYPLLYAKDHHTCVPEEEEEDETDDAPRVQERIHQTYEEQDAQEIHQFSERQDRSETTYEFHQESEFDSQLTESNLARETMFHEHHFRDETGTGPPDEGVESPDTEFDRPISETGSFLVDSAASGSSPIHREPESAETTMFEMDDIEALEDDEEGPAEEEEEEEEEDDEEDEENEEEEFVGISIQDVSELHSPEDYGDSSSVDSFATVVAAHPDIDIEDDEDRLAEVASLTSSYHSEVTHTDAIHEGRDEQHEDEDEEQETEGFWNQEDAEKSSESSAGSERYEFIEKTELSVIAENSEEERYEMIERGELDASPDLVHSPPGLGLTTHPRYFGKSAERDDVSLSSSLAEFERLEHDMAGSLGDRDSLPGSYEGRAIHVRSGDNSVASSLAEFERLEREIVQSGSGGSIDKITDGNKSSGGEASSLSSLGEFEKLERDILRENEGRRSSSDSCSKKSETGSSMSSLNEFERLEQEIVVGDELQAEAQKIVSILESGELMQESESEQDQSEAQTTILELTQMTDSVEAEQLPLDPPSSRTFDSEISELLERDSLDGNDMDSDSLSESDLGTMMSGDCFSAVIEHELMIEHEQELCAGRTMGDVDQDSLDSSLSETKPTKKGDFDTDSLQGLDNVMQISADSIGSDHQVTSLGGDSEKFDTDSLQGQEFQMDRSTDSLEAGQQLPVSDIIVIDSIETDSLQGGEDVMQTSADSLEETAHTGPDIHTSMETSVDSTTWSLASSGFSRSSQDTLKSRSSSSSGRDIMQVSSESLGMQKSIHEETIVSEKRLSSEIISTKSDCEVIQTDCQVTFTETHSTNPFLDSEGNVDHELKTETDSKEIYTDNHYRWSTSSEEEEDKVKEPPFLDWGPYEEKKKVFTMTEWEEMKRAKKQAAEEKQKMVELSSHDQAMSTDPSCMEREMSSPTDPPSPPSELAPAPPLTQPAPHLPTSPLSAVPCYDQGTAGITTDIRETELADDMGDQPGPPLHSAHYQTRVADARRVASIDEDDNAEYDITEHGDLAHGIPEQFAQQTGPAYVGPQDLADSEEDEVLDYTGTEGTPSYEQEGASVSSDDQVVGADGGDYQATRVVMKRQTHKRTIIKDDGQEQTLVTVEAKVEQDNEAPGELKDSMQQIIDQFMEGQGEFEHQEFEQPQFLEDDV